MVDRWPAKRGKTSDPLDKRVPKNPKYQGVSSVVKTGKTMRDVEILSNHAVAKRKGELFKRIRCTTLAKLLKENENQESIYQMGEGNEQVKEFNDLASQYSAAPSEALSVFSVVTVNTEALGINQDTEFMLLDLRDPSEYERFHIKDAISFPAPNITRDRIPPELFRLKNVEGKLIIVYQWDERPGVEASQKFVQRGFDNVFLVSGGVEEFGKQFPELIQGEFPVQSPVKGRGMRSTGFSRGSRKQYIWWEKEVFVGG